MNEKDIILLLFERSKTVIYNKILSVPHKRNKFLDQLNHNPHFDERYTKWFSSFRRAVKSLDVNQNAEVYIMSDAPEIDQTYITFADAVYEVPNYGWGTIIGISPNIALYYGELGEIAAVIKKP